ncbi:MAG: hypothetical protein U9N30_05965 [Campylobacterota bacterium]|nr:hypothetical protein [Campylobacterota bacterium]
MKEKISIKQRVSNKINEHIEKGTSVKDYLEDLIVPKTYGSFRIYAKSIQDALVEYANQSDLTPENIQYINQLMEKKRKQKVIISKSKIDFESYFEKLQLSLDYAPEALDQSKLNVLFILPFFHKPQMVEAFRLVLSKTTVKEAGAGYILKTTYEPNLEEKNSKNHTIQNYYIYFKSYGDIYKKALEHLKQTKNDGMLIDVGTQQINNAYKIIGKDLENELNPFTNEKANDISPLTATKIAFQKSPISKEFFFL